LLTFGLLVACTGNEAGPERLCTPGAYVYCRCQNRDPGTKLCQKSGQEFEACLPCDGSGDTGTGSGGTDALGGRMSSEGDDDGDDKTGDDPNKTREEQLEAGAPEPPPTPQEDDGGADAGTSTSTPDAGKPTTSKPPTQPGPEVDAPHCKPIINKAPKIEVQKIADVPTAAKGGKPQDGVYLQSWVVEFTGPDGESGPSKHWSKETLEIRGNYGRYSVDDDDGKKVVSGGMRLTLNGTKVNVEYECPAAEPRELSFDADDRQIIVYDPPYARVFIKQKEAQ
jgi:hypothetical protein